MTGDASSDAASSLSASSDGPRSDAILGNCLFMCPDEELRERENARLLHPFEIQKGTESYRRPLADRKRVVKEFRRPAAGKGLRTNELRPIHVLVRTVKYLLGDLMRELSQRPQGPFTLDAYDFIFDRLRAVRQDLVVQRAACEGAVQIYELTLSFLVLFGYRLCTEPNFVVKFNETHVAECFGQLLSLYDGSASTLLRQPAKGQALSSHQRRFARNFSLFHSMNALNSLDRGDAVHQLLNRVPTPLHDRPPVSTAVAVGRAYQAGNYFRFFKILARDVQSPLLLAVVMKHCVFVQVKALTVMRVAYSSKNMSYPLDHLCQVLMFRSEEEAVELLSSLGVKTLDNRVIFSKSSGSGSHAFPTDELDSAPKRKRFRFIDELLLRFPFFPLKN